MNLNMLNHRFIAVLATSILLVACANNPQVSPPTPTQKKQTTNAGSATKSEPKSGSGGYYLDDGPGDNPPPNIDAIPNATLTSEQPNERANRPYSALGQQYTPMTSYIPYKKQGIASWYGKRYNGKKTSTGEIYDMYAMSAAHTTLPIPSFAKVTNPANGRSVIVRINDRGPFKHDRLIDLSYAAAYQLRLIKDGSGLVEVETIDTSSEALRKLAAEKSTQAPTLSQNISSENSPPNNANSPVEISEIKPVQNNNTLLTTSSISASPTQFYVQAGAFKNESNGDLLQKKIQSLELGENVGVANVYNDGLYRVKLGPYASRSEADISATNIRKKLNIAVHVTN
jgi:rare lipoprotein A